MGLRESFFGYLMTFIKEAYLSPLVEVDYKLCAEVPQDDWELIEILGPARSISELPENLQKIALQSIPYFLKETTIYTEEDIPY